jgi:mono/diheme cytochrome c family protein
MATHPSQAQSAATSKEALVHAGQDLFTQKCHQCHSVVEGQYSFGPNLYHEMKKSPKKTPADVRAILKNGKNKMPAFGDKLSEDDTKELLAYLQTL